MPAVHTFWQLPADEQDFLDFLQSTGTILALPDEWVKRKEDLVPQSVAAFLHDRDPTQLQFGPERFVLEAGIEEHVKGGETYFAIAYMKPCLMAYRRGRVSNGNKLAQSNLAAYWEYLDKERNATVRKNAEFIKWAKKVFGWARKSCPARLAVNGFAYPATTRVREAFETGAIQLALY